MNEDIYKEIHIGSGVFITRCTRDKYSGDVSVTYEGTGRCLIAAGLMTMQDLATSGPAGKRKKHIDSAGFPVVIRPWWRRPDTGGPYRVYRLTFYRPAARIAELPGASEALTTHDACEAGST